MKEIYIPPISKQQSDALLDFLLKFGDGHFQYEYWRAFEEDAEKAIQFASTIEKYKIAVPKDSPMKRLITWILEKCKRTTPKAPKYKFCKESVETLKNELPFGVLAYWGEVDINGFDNLKVTIQGVTIFEGAKHEGMGFFMLNKEQFKAFKRLQIPFRTDKNNWGRYLGTTAHPNSIFFEYKTKQIVDSKGKKRNLRLIYVDTLQDALIFLPGEFFPGRKFLLILACPTQLLTDEIAVKLPKAGAEYIMCTGKNASELKNIFKNIDILESIKKRRMNINKIPQITTHTNESKKEIWAYALKWASNNKSIPYKKIAIVICKDKRYYHNWKTYLKI